MLKHDGLQHMVTRHKRELADTPEVNTRDRMHLATRIQEHSYRLETLVAYILKPWAVEIDSCRCFCTPRLYICVFDVFNYINFDFS